MAGLRDPLSDGTMPKYLWLASNPGSLSKASLGSRLTYGELNVKWEYRFNGTWNGGME